MTGGSGFIGSHLCQRLLKQGHDVLVVDNFYSSSRRNVIDLLGEPRFELMRHDVTFPLYVEVDQIYHLACPASSVFYQRDLGNPPRRWMKDSSEPSTTSAARWPADGTRGPRYVNWLRSPRSCGGKHVHRPVQVYEGDHASVRVELPEVPGLGRAEAGGHHGPSPG